MDHPSSSGMNHNTNTNMSSHTDANTNLVDEFLIGSCVGGNHTFTAPAGGERGMAYGPMDSVNSNNNIHRQGQDYIHSQSVTSGDSGQSNGENSPIENSSGSHHSGGMHATSLTSPQMLPASSRAGLSSAGQNIAFDSATSAHAIHTTTAGGAGTGRAGNQIFHHAHNYHDGMGGGGNNMSPVNGNNNFMDHASVANMMALQRLFSLMNEAQCIIKQLQVYGFFPNMESVARDPNAAVQMLMSLMTAEAQSTLESARAGAGMWNSGNNNHNSHEHSGAAAAAAGGGDNNNNNNTRACNFAETMAHPGGIADPTKSLASGQTAEQQRRAPDMFSSTDDNNAARRAGGDNASMSAFGLSDMMSHQQPAESQLYNGADVVNSLLTQKQAQQQQQQQQQQVQNQGVDNNTSNLWRLSAKQTDLNEFTAMFAHAPLPPQQQVKQSSQLGKDGFVPNSTGQGNDVVMPSSRNNEFAMISESWAFDARNNNNNNYPSSNAHHNITAMPDGGAINASGEMHAIGTVESVHGLHGNSSTDAQGRLSSNNNNNYINNNLASASASSSARNAKQRSRANGRGRSDEAAPISAEMLLSGGGVHSNGTPATACVGAATTNAAAAASTLPSSSPAAAAGADSSVEMESNEMMACVEFKRNRIRKYVCSSTDIEPGAYVLVDGDRGTDCGLLVQTTRQLPDGAKAVTCMDGCDVKDEKIKLENGRVLRRASNQDIDRLHNIIANAEAVALRTCRQRCHELGIDIDLLDVEYQFDMKKISFFFDCDHSVDFRSLVRELYRTFGARIWMENVNPKVKNSMPDATENSNANANGGSAGGDSVANGRAGGNFHSNHRRRNN